MLHLAFDRLASEDRGYPNLSQWRADPYTAQWRQYDQHWPHVVPLRLDLFLRELCIPVRYHDVLAAPAGAWYPVGISWWDFKMDYISLIPAYTKDLIRQQHLRLLFYYHEGDNPRRIRDRINQCLDLHDMTHSVAILISGNSAAAMVPGCVYFDDFECWFSVLNKHQVSGSRPERRPHFDFTVLSRTHKWWRATIMHDLRQDGILDRSVWSYGDMPCGDQWCDNPIECGNRELQIRQFVAQGPYMADTFDPDQQNDHHSVNTALYTASHFHVVLETHFDADQSGGSFITEKTYKCIKYGQPFLIAGPAGSLSILRDHGYRVFDSVLDNSYDQEPNNTRRWNKLQQAIKQISRDVHNLSDACKSDVVHNQRLFLHRPVCSVNKLLEKLL
jgi:hypothetical protein